jgi:hypothetical protein
MAIKTKEELEASAKGSTRAEKFVKEMPGGGGVRVSPGETDEVAIDEEEDEGVAETSDDDDGGEATTRLGKKKNRFSELRRERDDVTKKLADEQRRADMAEMAARSAQQYAQGVQALLGSQGKPDPHEAELERLAREQQSLIDAFNGRRNSLPKDQDLPAEEYAKVRTEMQKLQDARFRLIAKREQGAQPQGITQHEARVQANEAILREKYPDIMGNAQYATYTAHAYNAKKAAGLDDAHALEAAVEEARVTFKLKRAAPSNVEKQRLSGLGSAQASSAAAGKRTIAMTPDMKKLAQARYPKLAPPEAWKKWAQRTGPKVLEDEARR